MDNSIQLSRRQVFKLGAIAAGTTFLTKGAHQGLAMTPLVNSQSLELEKMTQATFAALLNTSFEMRAENQSIYTTLIAVVDQPQDSHLEQFTLKFQGSQSSSLPQGTYLFQHAQLGQFSLFVVPTQQGDYQAAFNRLKL